MVSRLSVSLSSTGLAVFDPAVVTDFATRHSIDSPNLFDYFLQHPAVGNAAIRQGVVLPVYSIPPLDYQVIVNDEAASVVPPEWHKLSSPAFPLQVSSGTVVAADIYALMDWEPQYYQEDEQAQAAVALAAGLYKVVINGFCEAQYSSSVPKNKGYELLCAAVAELPAVDESLDIDDIDFVVFGEV